MLVDSTEFYQLIPDRLYYIGYYNFCKGDRFINSKEFNLFSGNNNVAVISLKLFNIFASIVKKRTMSIQQK